MATAVRVLRAQQWIHFAVLPLAGLDGKALGAPAGLARGVIGIIAASLALGYAYGINALADRTTDKSIAKNPLAGSHSVPASALLAVVAAGAGALASSVLLGPWSTVLVVASLVAATIYSVPPRLKAQPFLGLLCNTLIFAPLLGLALEDGTTPRAFTVLCTTFVGLLMQSQLLHETADAAEDQAAGALTTARLLGAYGTRAMVIAIALVFTVVGFAHAPEPLLGWMSAVALGVGAATSVFARRPGDARGLLRVVALVGGVALFLVGTVA